MRDSAKEQTRQSCLPASPQRRHLDDFRQRTPCIRYALQPESQKKMFPSTFLSWLRHCCLPCFDARYGWVPVTLLCTEYGDPKRCSSRWRSIFFFFISSGGWVKNQIHVFRFNPAPVATAARAAATGLVSMSTRPNPEGSGTLGIATRRCPRLRVVSVAKRPSIFY